MASETPESPTHDYNGIYLLNGNPFRRHEHPRRSGLVSTGPRVHFGSSNDSAEDYYYVSIGNSTASALGVGNSSGVGAGYTISTQSAAQNALEALNEAIISKDNIRASLGATQNRLQNTISNLQIQAENLQSSESRISDVDVATEMTEFVRHRSSPRPRGHAGPGQQPAATGHVAAGG
jgi:flagellin